MLRVKKARCQCVYLQIAADVYKSSSRGHHASLFAARSSYCQNTHPCSLVRHENLINLLSSCMCSYHTLLFAINSTALIIVLLFLFGAYCRYSSESVLESLMELLSNRDFFVLAAGDFFVFKWLLRFFVNVLSAFAPQPDGWIWWICSWNRISQYFEREFYGCLVANSIEFCFVLMLHIILLCWIELQLGWRSNFLLHMLQCLFSKGIHCSDTEQRHISTIILLTTDETNVFFVAFALCRAPF